MAAMIAEHDWCATRLGARETWPQALRIAVDICLNSRFPMFVWWGPELINIYNDAYTPMLGKRHPQALGKPAQEIWGEIWDVVGPQTDAVMLRGEATWNERVLLTMERHGYIEETYFTWSYSPIYEGGRVAGLFCAVIEETERVKAERERDRLDERLRLAMDARAHLAAIVESSDDAIISKSLEGIIQSWNAGAQRIFGYTAEEAIGKPILMLLPPDRKDEEIGILKRLRRGERIDHYESVRLTRTGG
jgi:PAS domain-containing protein